MIFVTSGSRLQRQDRASIDRSCRRSFFIVVCEETARGREQKSRVKGQTTTYRDARGFKATPTPMPQAVHGACIYVVGSQPNLPACFLGSRFCIVTI